MEDGCNLQFDIPARRFLSACGAPHRQALWQAGEICNQKSAIPVRRNVVETDAIISLSPNSPLEKTPL